MTLFSTKTTGPQILHAQTSPVATEIQLRRAGPGDAASLALLGQATFLEAYAGVLEHADIVAHCEKQHAREKYATWLMEPETAIWLAEVEAGKAPIGYLLLTRPDLPLENLHAGDLEVKRIYVFHRFQGHRVGRRLMEAAKDYARANGSQRLLLGVYENNAPALAFYEKLGFQKVGTRRFQVGTRTYDDYVLGLTLS